MARTDGSNQLQGSKFFTNKIVIFVSRISFYEIFLNLFKDVQDIHHILYVAFGRNEELIKP